MRVCSDAEMWGSDTFHATTSQRVCLAQVDFNGAKKLFTRAERARLRIIPMNRLVGTSPAAMRTQASATSTAGSPRHARAQSMTTGPRGLIITLSGCRSKWRRPTPRPTGASTNQSGAASSCSSRWRSASVQSSTRNAPRAVAHHCDHVRPLDALDNHVETVGADFFKPPGNGEPLDSDIFHDPSLLYHRTSSRDAEALDRAMLEDVGVPARRQRGSRIRRVGQSS